MAGNHNSGRKPLGWYRDLNDLLDRSFDTIMIVLNDESIPLLERGKIAQAFLVKKVGEKIDLTIEHKHSVGELDGMMARIKGYIDNRTSNNSINSGN